MPLQNFCYVIEQIANILLFEEYQELEALADPMRKEVSVVRKRIDSINKELKPLGHTCQKKVRLIQISNS
jgi:hypothetical protein